MGNSTNHKPKVCLSRFQDTAPAIWDWGELHNNLNTDQFGMYINMIFINCSVISTFCNRHWQSYYFSLWCIMREYKIYDYNAILFFTYLFYMPNQPSSSLIITTTVGPFWWARVIQGIIHVLTVDHPPDFRPLSISRYCHQCAESDVNQYPLTLCLKHTIYWK